MTAKKKTPALKRGEVLIMKVVEAGGVSHGGFVWPLTVGSVVEAPDWDPSPSCGGGLHGWLWGLGDLSACGDRHASADAVWMALAVTGADVVDLGRKVKFARCRIVEVGDRTAVANLIAQRRPAGMPMPMFGQAAAGARGQAEAGSRGQAAAGSRGQAAAGEFGQATAGEFGQAAAGGEGLAACGIGGIVKGGASACLVAGYWRDARQVGHCYAMGQVGRDGIEADVWYEGTADGLRRVPDGDARVQAWDEAWALFDQRKADRNALAAKSDEAQRGVLAASIAGSIKPAGKGGAT